MESLRYLYVSDCWGSIKGTFRDCTNIIGRGKDCLRVSWPIVILEVPYVVPYLDTWPDNYLESVALSQGVSDGIS